MSHEVESMAYAGAVPWHGLGKKVRDGALPDEMLRDAGLDWEISRERIYAEVDGKKISIPGRRAHIRKSDHKVMTITGQDWKGRQNIDMANFFAEYCKAGALQMETMISLRGGNIVCGLAKFNGGYTVGKHDKVQGYLLFIMPHTVGTTDSIRCTPVRVVCANTMAAALSNNICNYTQNHMKSFNFDKAKETVELAHDSLREAGKRANTLHKLKLSMSDQLKFLGKFFVEKQDLSGDELAEIVNSDKASTLKAVVASLTNAPGAEPDTAWGTLNAVTHWADHVNGRNAASRLFRSWVADVATTKSKVETELFALAQ